MIIFHLVLEMLPFLKPLKNCSIAHMNKIFKYFVFPLLVIACSEGDVIENNISEVNGTLENCANLNENTFVFYKIDPQINQAISLAFTSTTFDLDTVPEGLSTTITLNGTSNTIIYRRFDTAIDGATYFCASVPPSGINVTQELISSNGNAVITYVINTDTATETVYDRIITLTNVTFEGPGVAIRQELLEFGSDEITIAK